MRVQVQQLYRLRCLLVTGEGRQATTGTLKTSKMISCRHYVAGLRGAYRAAHLSLVLPTVSWPPCPDHMFPPADDQPATGTVPLLLTCWVFLMHINHYHGLGAATTHGCSLLSSPVSDDTCTQASATGAAELAKQSSKQASERSGWAVTARSPPAARAPVVVLTTMWRRRWGEEGYAHALCKRNAHSGRPPCWIAGYA